MIFMHQGQNVASGTAAQIRETLRSSNVAIGESDFLAEFMFALFAEQPLQLDALKNLNTDNRLLRQESTHATVDAYVDEERAFKHIFVQYKAIVKRECRVQVRNTFDLAIEYGLPCVFYTIWSIFYYNGAQDDLDEAVRPEAIPYAMICLGYSTTPIVKNIFLRKRNVFKTEYESHTYGITPYFLAMLTMVYAKILLLAFLGSTIMFPPGGFPGNWFVNLFSSYITMLALSSLVICGVTLVDSEFSAMVLDQVWCTCFGIPAFATAGAFMNQNALNTVGWFVWVRFGSVLLMKENYPVEFNEKYYPDANDSWLFRIMIPLTHILVFTIIALFSLKNQGKQRF